MAGLPDVSHSLCIALSLSLSLSLRQYCTTGQLPDHRVAGLPESRSLSVSLSRLLSLSLLNLLVQENHTRGLPSFFFSFSVINFFSSKKKN